MTRSREQAERLQRLDRSDEIHRQVLAEGGSEDEAREESEKVLPEK
ncbi:hypothetical protein GCM10010191_67600 [Actinomadura vinacea]|uniref:Uncharacterized protein n=1 Tax=Actinomadura vinacea TaxID=115336 RepID=A0ABN3JYS0_9ACTN